MFLWVSVATQCFSELSRCCRRLVHVSNSCSQGVVGGHAMFLRVLSVVTPCFSGCCRWSRHVSLGVVGGHAMFL